MKTFRRMTAIALSALMILSVCVIGASAAEGAKTFSLVSYNVAGLPDWQALIGKSKTDVAANQAQIGKQLNEKNADIILTQEDFGYHDSLVAELTGYRFKTNHTGGVPGGDGMNIYAHTPIYNEKRITWQKAYGVIDDGADEMTPKGILYAVIDVGDGVFVDFYDLHADAYGDAGSKEARRDNFRQLAELIDANDHGRPVIVTGDFNISGHHSDDDGFTEILIEGAGFKDAWTELFNGGDYHDFSDAAALYGAEYWGVWDSVEKYLYKDGGGVTLRPETFLYEWYRDAESGESLSDHASAYAIFSYETGSTYVPTNKADLAVVRENSFNVLVNRITYIIKDIAKLLSHIGDLSKYLNGDAFIDE
ncbi:MAG: endonuclease/exonuclease/phosphatase family protein [Clostridia bacterium]|nr:endonuclease/exonuclease/phosphatase family protein [Clostridia bacterium]